MRLTPLLLLFFACTTQAAAPKPVVAEAPTFKTELEANAKQLALRILDAMPAVSIRNAAVARLNSLETLSAKCETDFHAIKGRNAAHAPTSCQGLENAVADVLEQFRQEYLAATFNAINVEKPISSFGIKTIRHRPPWRLLYLVGYRTFTWNWQKILFTPPILLNSRPSKPAPSRLSLLRQIASPPTR